MSVAPHIVVIGRFLRSPHEKKFMKAWEETLELAWLCLHDATRRMKKYADRENMYLLAQWFPFQWKVQMLY